MKRLLLAIVAFVGLLALWSAVYTIAETEQVIITQFGEPVGLPHTNPGLHVKVPFIETVYTFDKRWLEWSGDPNQIPTRDKNVAGVGELLSVAIALDAVFRDGKAREAAAVGSEFGHPTVDGESQHRLDTAAAGIEDEGVSVSSGRGIGRGKAFEVPVGSAAGDVGLPVVAAGGIAAGTVEGGR